MTPTTPTGKRLVAWMRGTPHIDDITEDDILAIEAEKAAQERERLRTRLGGDGWVRLANGTSATVVHLIADDCECGGLGCELDPEP
jgi:hypothetical protein